MISDSYPSSSFTRVWANLHPCPICSKQLLSLPASRVGRSPWLQNVVARRTSRAGHITDQTICLTVMPQTDLKFNNSLSKLVSLLELQPSAIRKRSSCSLTW